MGKRRAPDSSAAAAAAAAAEQEDIEDPGILADDSSDDGEGEGYSGDEQDAMQSSGSGEDDGERPGQHVMLSVRHHCKQNSDIKTPC
jgi:hypothetical protein